MKIELDNTEEKIVRAAFDIIQKEGLTKATTKRIAAEAGVNEVTVFRKFKNKNNLVEITKAYHFQILIGKLEEIFDFREDEETDVPKRISASSRWLLRTWGQSPTRSFWLHRLQMQYWTSLRSSSPFRSRREESGKSTREYWAHSVTA